MFWGATVGEHVDWDGNGLYLDGLLPLPAPDEDVARARQSMSDAEKQWLAAVQDMQVCSQLRDFHPGVVFACGIPVARRE